MEREEIHDRLPVLWHNKLRLVRLANGLQVVLSENPDADTCACTMTVRCGSFADPEDLPGLAHFCEHMLFLGTEKYPDEGDFETFLAAHRGTHNAGTGSERTSYFFSVLPAGFAGALERFAQFFVAPLFTESATEREINAINNEHKKNVPDEQRRTYAVVRTACVPGHPCGKFPTGCTATLGARPLPELRAALLALFDRYYTPRNMVLALEGPLALDALERLAAVHFGAVPVRAGGDGRGAPPPMPTEAPALPFPADAEGRTHLLLRAVPLTPQRAVTVLWQVADDLRRARGQDAMNYVADLLGHESEGSVLALLKACAPRQVVPYLEFLVTEGRETRTAFHDELAFQYLDTLRALYAAAGGFPTKRPFPEPGAEPGEIGACRRALLHFLETSDHYRPEALLTGMRIPVAGLFEERAVVLSKIGSHDKALAIYALDLGSSARAEAYCRAHYAEDREGARDVYLTLLQVYLRPPPAVPGAPPRPTEPLLAPALRLLSEHYQHINITEALGLLPTATPLAALMPFFERVLAESARQRRDGQIVRALLRSEALRVREEHIAACAPYVYVDDATLCARCHRPLRTSAFVRYPDSGQIVHMMCHQKAEAAGGGGAGSAGLGTGVGSGSNTFGSFHADYTAASSPSPAPAYTPSPSYSPSFAPRGRASDTPAPAAAAATPAAAPTIVEDYTASASASPAPPAPEEVPFPGVAACTSGQRTAPAASSPSPSLARRAAAVPVPHAVPAPAAASPQAVSATNPFYDPEPVPAPQPIPQSMPQSVLQQTHRRPAMVSTNPFADDFDDAPAAPQPSAVRPTNPFDDDYDTGASSTSLPPTNPFA